MTIKCKLHYLKKRVWNKDQVIALIKGNFKPINV